MKVCTVCLCKLPLEAFYTRRASKDGLMPKCISCCREYRRVVYWRNAKENRRKAKMWARLHPGRVVERVAAWRKTPKGKACRTREYRVTAEKNPGKATARWKAKRYVKIEPCVVCGSTEKVERHHSDYRKHLDVTFLCQPHHKAWHRVFGN